MGVAARVLTVDMNPREALLRQANAPKDILTVCYEPVTGAHVGPGTVALFFLGDSDVRSH